MIKGIQFFFFQLEQIPLLNKLHLGVDCHRPQEKMHLAFAEINIVQQCPGFFFGEVNLSLEEGAKEASTLKATWRRGSNLMGASSGNKQCMATCCFPVPCQESSAKQRHPRSQAGTSNTSKADSELAPLAGT